MSPTPPTRIRHPAHRPTWRVLAGVVLLAAALPLATPNPVEGASGWEDVATSLPSYPKSVVLDHGRPRVVYPGPPNDALYFGWCDDECTDRSSWHSIELADGLDLDGTKLTIDRAGRLHVAYIDLVADGVFYAMCATACGDAGSWSHAKVDTTNNQRGLTLAVDPWGRPRLSYIRSRPDVETSPKHVFAACDTGCTTPESWSNVDLGVRGGNYPSLAFDGAKPRMAYSRGVSVPQGTELRYAACEADCLNKRAWTVTKVTWFDSIGEPSLVVDGSRVHIAFNPAGAAATTLAYTRCDGGCTEAGNWHEPAFVTPGDRALAPQLEVTKGRPRIAFLHCEACLTTAERNHVKYATCDRDCTGKNADGWDIQYLATAPGAPRLALDGERPRVVYHVGESGTPGNIRYAFCDACGAAGSWPAPPSSPPPPSWPPPGSSSGGGSGGDGGSGGGDGGSGGEGGSSGGAGGVGGGFVATGGSAGSGGGSGSTSSTARESEDVSAGGAGSVLVDGSGRAVGSAAGAGDGGSGVSARRVDGESEGLGEQVSRLPGAAIDVIRNPSQALSWPWGRIFLKGLAIGLLGLVGWMTYVASFDRFHRRTAG